MSADLMSLQESDVADTGAVQQALCPICAIPRGYRSLSNTRWASRPWTLRLDRTAAEYHSNTHGYQKAMRDSGQAGSGDSQNMSSGCSLRRLLSRRLPTLALWLLAQIPGPFLSRLVPFVLCRLRSLWPTVAKLFAWHHQSEPLWWPWPLRWRPGAAQGCDDGATLMSEGHAQDGAGVLQAWRV